MVSNRAIGGRAETAPSQCVDDCDSAYEEAESQGKSAELCAKGSSFLELINFCNECINHFGFFDISERSKYGEGIVQYLDYCDASSGTLSSSLPPVTQTPTEGDPPTPIPTTTFTFTIKVTATEAGRETVYLLPETTTDPPMRTTIITATVPAGTFTQTVTGIDWRQLMPTHPTSDVADPEKTGTSSSQNTEQGTTNSLAWIAGPIVGGLAAIGIIVILYLVWRKRKDKKKTEDISNGESGLPNRQKSWHKPELHSDHIHQLEDSHPPSKTPPNPVEME